MIASDASPLICLAKAGKLHLLRELFGKVVIEEEVKRETIERGKEERAPDALVIEDAIKEALESDKGKEARERIKNMFPIKKKKRKGINENNQGDVKCKSQL
jgi:predicted nucleic acid-binding protein